MKKLSFILIILAILFLASCRSSKTSVQTITKEVIRVEYRDTTIFVKIPGDTVFHNTPVPVAINITTPIDRLDTRFATSLAWIENSLLRHTLIQKETDVPATITGAIQRSTAITEKEIRVPYPVDRPTRMPLRWIEKALLISGLIAWGLILAYTIIRIRKSLTLKSLIK